MTDIFSTLDLGPITLQNRMVMAPLTRARATVERVPTPIMAKYYAQRASAGLIITEATSFSDQGSGYVNTPGIQTDKMVAEWRKVTDAVHEAGGRIFLQMWHVGRVSHPDFHGGDLPVAPSAIGFEGESFTPEGKKKIVTPRALELDEIPGIVEAFANGARRAIEAGFDGVEVHGANGYLLDQFMRDGSNQRTDIYGGSIENRIRFPLEVTRAVAKAIGAERVGYRLSSINVPMMGASDSNIKETACHIVTELNKLGLAYLHVIEPLPGSGMAEMAVDLRTGEDRVTRVLRPLFDGPLIVNGGYDKAYASEVLQKGEGDLVAFGVPFLANPDLPARFAADAELNLPDPETFYGGGEKGYTDYSTLKETDSVT